MESTQEACHIQDDKREDSSPAKRDFEQAPSEQLQVPQPAAAPKYQPISHEPILLGEIGYGLFKSRLVFEADPCPPEKLFGGLDYENFEYTNVKEGTNRIKADGTKSKKKYTGSGAEMNVDTVFQRMSASEKLTLWRNNGTISKLKDGEIRRNERLIVLLEHEPCGPKVEASRWADKVKHLEHVLKKNLPDSHITLRTFISASDFVGDGRFRPYINVLLDLLRKYPHHFCVELEDQSIMDADPADFHPTTEEDDYNVEKQRKLLTPERVCHIKGFDDEDPLNGKLLKLAENEEYKWRQAEQEKMGRRPDYNWYWIEGWMNQKIKEWREEILARVTDKLQARCQEINEEFRFIWKFVEDIRHFNSHGVLPGEAVQPFKPMKQNKRKKPPVVPAYFDPFRKANAVDPAEEAKRIISVLPWISEERAEQHVAQMLSITEQDPTAEYPPLERSEQTSPALPSITTNTQGPEAPPSHVMPTSPRKGKRGLEQVDVGEEPEDEHKKARLGP